MPTGAETLLLVVELLTPFGEQDKEALFEACSRAFDGGSCIEQSSDPKEELFFAKVESGGPQHVLIEVNIRGSAQQLYTSREISFQPEDAPGERARALGLSLGVLANSLREEQLSQTVNNVDEVDEAPADEPEKEAPAPKKREEPITQKELPAEKAVAMPTKKRSSKTNTKEQSFIFGLAGGVDINPTWPKVGPSGDLSAGVFLLPSLSLLARFSASYQGSGDDGPRLSFLSPSFGLGWLGTFDSLSLFVTLEGGTENVTAFITDSGNPNSVPKLSHWSGFVRTSASIMLPVGAGFHLSLVPALVVNFKPTKPVVDGVEQGSTGLVRFVTRAGLTWTY